MRCPLCFFDIAAGPRNAEPPGRCPRCGAELPPAAAAPVPAPTAASSPAPGPAAATTVTVDAGPAVTHQPTLTPAAPGASFESPEGKTIGGYEVLECIGQGGMGAVYRARQAHPRRVVALKVLLPGERVSAEQVARFQREAQVVAGLRHPGIIAIHDVGTWGNVPYFTMDFIEGRSLQSLLAQEGKLPAERALPLLRAVALALDHAHEHGVIHRDIKPGNILLDAEGRPVLTDFGIAKEVDSTVRLTKSGTTLGTPAYMSPEQADGDLAAIDRTSDVYSLGAVLYECLTGRPPFAGATEVQIILKVLSADPARPRALDPAVPLDVETICLKCLEKDRTRRYASARELVAEIDRWLAGEPILARPTGLLTRAARRLRRRRREAVLAAAALLVVAAVGAWAWREARRAAAERADVAAREAERAERRRAYDRAFSDAITQLSLNRHDRAIAAFTRAIDAEPDNPEARFRRAGAFKLAGQADRALADLDEVVRLDPRHLLAFLLRGEIAYDKKDYERAARDFDEVLRLDPQNAVAAFDRGNCRLALGHFGRAREDFDRALAIDRRFARAYGHRALAWKREGDLPRALADLDHALELAPDDVETLQNRANTLNAVGRHEEAFRDATEAVRLGQRSPDLYLVRGDALAAKGRLADAVSEYDRGLKLDPDHVATLVNRGDAYNSLGEPARALRDLRKAVKLDPNHAAAHLDLGNAYLLAGETEKALAAYDRAVQLDPRNASAHSDRGQALFTLGRVTDAEGAVARALALDGDHAAALCVRAQIELGRGDAAAAVADCTRALAGHERRLPRDQVYLIRGWAHLRLDQGDAAIADFSAAIEANPRDARPWSRRAVCQAAAGRTEQALADNAEALRLAPADGSAHFDRGWILLAAHRPQEALASFESACRHGHDPGRVASAYAALALVEAGRTREGMARAEEILVQDPANARARTALGIGALRLQDWARAEATFRAAVAAEPAAPGGHYNLAAALGGAGRLDEAFAALGRAVELGYRDADELARDPDLAPLRADARFAAVLERVRQAGGK